MDEIGIGAYHLQRLQVCMFGSVFQCLLYPGFVLFCLTKVLTQG